MRKTFLKLALHEWVLVFLGMFILFILILLALPLTNANAQEYETKILKTKILQCEEIEFREANMENLNFIWNAKIAEERKKVQAEDDSMQLYVRITDKARIGDKVIPYVIVEIVQRVPKKSTAPNAPTGLRIVE